MSVHSRRTALTPYRAPLRLLGLNAAVAVLYLVGGQLGLAFATVAGNVTLIWPPTGVAVAAVFLCGLRVVPGVAFGAFVVSAMTPAPLLFAFVVLVGNPLAAVIPYLLLRRLKPAATRPQSAGQVLWFVVVAALLGPMFSSTIGTLGLMGSTDMPSGGWHSVWLTWWIGDAMGVLLLAPTVLSASRWPQRAPDLRRRAEFALLMALLCTTGLLVFTAGTDRMTAVAFPYAVFPFIIWAAARFGLCGTAPAVLAIALVAIGATVLGVGPFATESLALSLIELHGFLGIASLSGLLLAAAVDEARGAREQLAQSRDDLERLVAERTAHLADELAERQRVEEGLSASEARFRAIFELSPVGIALSDDNSDPRHSNPAFQAMIGYDAAELAAIHYTDYTHPEDRAENARLFAELKAGVRDHYRMLKRYRHRDGSGFWGQLDVTRLPTGAIPGAYALSVVVDVSAQVAAENRLRQSHKLEALGQLTGGIAHEFNNRLAAILGFGNLALDRLEALDDERLRHYLDEIQRAAERSRDLVAKLLAHSRGSAAPCPPQAISLGKAASESAKTLASVLPSSIELHTEIDADLPLVLCDRAAFEQIIINLAINARDAMAGSGHLWLRARRRRGAGAPCASCGEPTTGEYVELAIEDSGPGIDDALRARVFDPFFTTKPVGEGTGMGLSMVHGLTHEAGGHLLIETSPAGGAALRLLFLFTTSEPLGQALPTPAAASAEGGGEHLLVVDDEKPLAAFLVELLTGYGYRVTVRESGTAALAAVRDSPQDFDLVLSDQTMPGMSGLELASKLRALRPDLPVILCSGYGDYVNGGKAAAEGPAAFLAKPVDPATLTAAIRAALDGKPTAN